jgi:PleD family two-component response regulator
MAKNKTLKLQNPFVSKVVFRTFNKSLTSKPFIEDFILLDSNRSTNQETSNTDNRIKRRVNKCKCASILVVDDNCFNIFSLSSVLKTTFKF